MRWVLPLVGLLAVAVAVYVGFGMTEDRPAPKPISTSSSTGASSTPAPAAAPSAPTADGLEQFTIGKTPLPVSAIPELVSVPAGVRNDVDYPAAKMSTAEITVGQFRQFVERTGYLNPAWASSSCEGADAADAGWASPGYAQTESHPVVCVNWDDARRYAQWLSQETGRRFRLPTDMEWEYAAAAGSNTRFWWGNGLTEANAVCADCGRQNPSKPWIVATLGRNAWGLFGTASNVREWTCSALPSGRCSSRQEGGARVTRGGSWHDPQQSLETGFRASLDKNQRNTWTGFRVMEERS